MTMEIAESKNGEEARDRIGAIEFLRQFYLDQYSLFMYGPSQFLRKDIIGTSTNTPPHYGGMRGRVIENEGRVDDGDDDRNRVF